MVPAAGALVVDRQQVVPPEFPAFPVEGRALSGINARAKHDSREARTAATSSNRARRRLD
ncbi:hypothetical protein ACWEV3_14435 [Saccharopolyspora sp. NPDC003752]